MERTQLFDLMGELKLYGMKAAFDEIMATAIKRQLITIEGTAHQERCSKLGSGARRSHSEGECAAASWKNAVS